MILFRIPHKQSVQWKQHSNQLVVVDEPKLALASALRRVPPWCQVNLAIKDYETPAPFFFSIGSSLELRQPWQVNCLNDFFSLKKIKRNSNTHIVHMKILKLKTK